MAPYREGRRELPWSAFHLSLVTESAPLKNARDKGSRNGLEMRVIMVGDTGARATTVTSGTWVVKGQREWLRAAGIA